ncbi:MAG: lipid II flippase MurJ [Acidimicrobiia bacterium]
MALNTSAKNSLYVFTGTLTSRILGFIRVVLIGTTLGYTRLSDSYSLANETPNMMYELILGSLIASTMVPFFVRQFKNKDSESDNALISFVVVSSLCLTAICLALSPFIADIMTSLNKSSNANAQSELVLFFLLFFLPQIFFYALTSAMSAYLAARAKFVAAAFAPVINNIIVILTVLWVRSQQNIDYSSLVNLTKSNDVQVLAIGTTLGVVAITFILAVVFIKNGGRFKFVSWKNESIKALISSSKWMVAYAFANQIALFVIIAIANGFKGGVAMYLVAWSFFQLPHGLIANSIMTTMVPKITHSMDGTNAGEKTLELIKQSALSLILFMCAISAIGIAVATPGLDLLLSHGNINSSQAEHTARVLIGFLSFLPAFSLYLFCVRIGNAFNLTKKIFYINVIQNLVNIILAISLKDKFGIVGISTSFSISYMIVIFLSIKLINTKLTHNFVEHKLSVSILTMSIAAAAIGYIASSQISNNFYSILAGLISSMIPLMLLLTIEKRSIKQLISSVKKLPA